MSKGSKRGHPIFNVQKHQAGRLHYDFPREGTIVVEEWNMLATAKDLEQRHLAKRLKHFGDFHRTAFRGVMVGRVEDRETFLEQLGRWEEDQPGFLDPVARIVPIDRTFEFTVADFSTALKEAVLAYADMIDNGSFYVRIERRGHAGEIHSQHVEQELDQAVRETLAQKGMTPAIDFKNPDVIVVAETVGDVCGVGVITRAMRTQYPFIRVP